MRHLLVLLGLCVALSAAPGVLASPLAPDLHQSLVQKSSSKSKSKNKSTTTGTISLNPIASVKHGKTGVPILANTSKKGLTCDMKIKYANGSTDSLDSVTSDVNKVCTEKPKPCAGN